MCFPSVLELVQLQLQLLGTSLLCFSLLLDLLILCLELLDLHFKLHSALAETLQVGVLAILQFRPLLHLAVEPCDLRLRLDVLLLELLVRGLEGFEL